MIIISNIILLLLENSPRIPMGLSRLPFWKHSLARSLDVQAMSMSRTPGDHQADPAAVIDWL